MKQKLLCLMLCISMPVTLFARPTVGLVLSGGGARGGAHVGVIEVLEQNHIPIDIIVGTSMGAVIGGLYARGVPIDIIKRDFTNLDWQQMFSMNIQRDNLYYRRKFDNDIFILKDFITYSNKQLHLPWGMITGQSLYDIFNSYVISQPAVENFSQLPISFKAVSTDLITGHAVVLDKGDLSLAMLASMAVPGIISPVMMDGHLLADGGVSENLPVKIAKNMGADVLIVVDVSTPLLTQSQITDLTSVLGQLSNILSHNNVIESEKLLRKTDILITPNLTGIDTEDFEKFETAIVPGRLAALEHIDRLQYLSYPEPPKAPYIISPINIEKIRVEDNSIVSFETFSHYLHFNDTTVDTVEITNAIDRLYGLDIFERIYYDVENNHLNVFPRIKNRDPIYFQGSVLLDSDFETDNTFALVLGITNPQVNSLLGEWRIIGRLGDGLGIGAEFYQPLEPTLEWFVNPQIGIRRATLPLFYDYEQWATYLNTQAQIGITFGKIFSNVARTYVFVEWQNNNFEQEVGTLSEDHFNAKNAQWGAALEWDDLDNLYFPHHGLKGKVKYLSNEHVLGSDQHYKQLIAQNLLAFSYDKHAFVLGGLYNRTFSGEPNFSALFSLGGLFELTGLSNQELIGENAGLVSAIYYYELSSIRIIPNRPSLFYIGGSIEWGKVWGTTNLSDNHGIYSGSLFAGVDSIIGPIYLSYGLTTNNHQAVHLVLRPPFG